LFLTKGDIFAGEIKTAREPHSMQVCGLCGEGAGYALIITPALFLLLCVHG
jgi:hypothetical protein